MVLGHTQLDISAAIHLYFLNTRQYVACIMPGGKKHFQHSWLTSTDTDVNGQVLSSWCRDGKDSYHGFCVYRSCQVNCDKSGRLQIVQHAKQVKHQKAVKFRTDRNQGRPVFKSPPSTSSASITSATVNLAATSSASPKCLNLIHWTKVRLHSPNNYKESALQAHLAG